MTKKKICLKIGGIPISISYPDSIDIFEDRYNLFKSNDKPIFKLDVACEPIEYLGVPKENLDVFLGVKNISRVNKKSRTKGIPPAVISGPNGSVLFQRRNFAGWIDKKRMNGKLLLKEGQEANGLSSFLRICYSELAIAMDGLLIHSAGLMKDGNGYLFFGVSETGKSTICTLSKDFATVLNDELTILRRLNNNYTIFGTPFSPKNLEYIANKKGPLRAILLPIKDKKTYIGKIKPVSFLLKFLSSVLYFGKEKQMLEKILNISEDIIYNVPYYKMHFRKDTSFWECIEEAIC